LLGDSHESSVGHLIAAVHDECGKPRTVLGDLQEGGIGQLLTSLYVEFGEPFTVLNNGNDSIIRQCRIVYETNYLQFLEAVQNIYPFGKAEEFGVWKGRLFFQSYDGIRH